MVKPGFIKAALFDLDDTIFDHTTVMTASLEHLAKVHGLPPDFVSIYLRINKSMWVDYEQGLISRDEIHYGRMRRALAECGRNGLDAKSMMEEYFAYYSGHQRLFSGARECLTKLGCIIKLGIITNGFVDVQRGKLEKTGIADLVDTVLISEETGNIKPHPDVFRLALERLGVAASEAIYIGDSFATDILGAEKAGIRTIWFNPQGARPTTDYHGEIAKDWSALEASLLAKINRGHNDGDSGDG
jgi:YjjG family noncanonical pyrimidine nucleotidase